MEHNSRYARSNRNKRDTETKYGVLRECFCTLSESPLVAIEAPKKVIFSVVLLNYVFKNSRKKSRNCFK